MDEKDNHPFDQRLEEYSNTAQTEMSRTTRRRRGKELLACTLAVTTPLSMAPAVLAAVQYSGVQNISLTAGMDYTLDIDGNGTDDFKFTYLGPRRFFVPQMANSVLATNPGPSYFAVKLTSNYSIKSGLVDWKATTAILNQSVSTWYPHFNNVEGFIGVSFERGGNTHYGWIKYWGNATSVAGKIISWAWEDQPDTPIKAGDIGSTSTSAYSYYLPGGSTASAYRIVTMPYDVSDASATSVIGPSIGGSYNNTMTRFGRWNTNHGIYDEYPNFGLNEPGFSFWAISRNPMFMNFSGTVPTLENDPIASNPCLKIPICHGWNQVGNGLLKHIDLSQAVVSDGVGTHEFLTAGTLTQGIFWGYKGDYSPTNNLQALEGGWIKYTASGCGYLYLPDSAYVADKAPDAVPIELSADVERPPDPPGLANASSGGKSNAGGGGGCFISATE